jgi:hypothetical protein
MSNIFYTVLTFNHFNKLFDFPLFRRPADDFLASLQSNLQGNSRTRRKRGELHVNKGEKMATLSVKLYELIWIKIVSMAVVAWTDF